ncbi:MAG: DUF3703 domain-containing protein [Candidatus Limnocylindrales bacterium]
MITSEPRTERNSKQHRRDVLRHMDRELAEAQVSADPWFHLERAHILSQPWAWPHTKVHAVMLRQALGDRDVREVLGQLLRFGVAGPGSLVGKYPAGNTGRATMGLTTTADVPADLEVILACDAGEVA